MKKLVATLLLVAASLTTHSQRPVSGAVPSGGSGTVLVPASVCDGGSALYGGIAIPSANAPARGCANMDASAIGYLDYYPSPSVAQYAYGQLQLPAPWKQTSATLTFYTPGNIGVATFEIQTACMRTGSALTPAWSTPVTISTTVPSTANQIVMSSRSPIATAGSNGCAAGSLLQYRIYRASSDTLTHDAYLIAVQLSGAN